MELTRIRFKQDFADLLIWYAVWVMCAVTLVFALIGLYHIIPHSPVPQLVLIGGGHGNPKPCENFVVMASLLLVPTVISLWAAWVAKRPLLLPMTKVRWVTWALIVIMTLVVFASARAPDFVFDVMNRHGYGLMSISVLLLLFIWFFDLKRLRNCSRTRIAAWVVLLSIFVIVSVGFRLFFMTNYLAIDSGSINAPIYPISQVFAGKTLLVDLPEQYGYYAAIFVPVLKLFHGRSLFGVTLAFSILLGVALIALLYVLHKEIRYNSLFFFGGLSLIFLNTKTYNWAQGGYNDPYYQYDPIRFFWPCISVLLFYLYAKNPTWLKSILLSLLAGVAVIWNLDTGIPLVGAFLAFLILRILFCIVDRQKPWQARKQEIVASLLKIVVHSVIVVSCFALFLYLTWLTSGGPVNYFWIFAYQRIFYLMGFAMLPMPLYLHPWMIVVAVYLFGIAAAQFYWYRHRGNSAILNFSLYLSILGLGLFVYYTGRSHIDTLLLVLWPAVIIAMLWVERLWQWQKENKLDRITLLITVPFWLFILVCSVNMLSVMPRFVAADIDFFRHTHIPADPLVASEIGFINTEKGKNTECVILSQRQGVYYLASQLANPITGPSILETILESDRDHFLHQLLTHPVKCLFFGVGDKTAAISIQIRLDSLLGRYQIQAKNTEGTMLLLVPKL